MRFGRRRHIRRSGRLALYHGNAENFGRRPSSKWSWRAVNWRSGVKPYLFMKIIDFARGGSELQNTPVAIIDATYRCRVWNPTDRPASNVNILVRNHSTGLLLDGRRRGLAH